MYKIKTALLTKILLSLFILIITSCNNKEDDPEPLEEYIQGNVGNEFLKYTFPFDPTILPPEAAKNFSNSYTPSSNQGVSDIGVINMIRTEEISLTKSFEIAIIGIDLDKVVLPIRFDPNNSTNRHFVEIQLRDYNGTNDIYSKTDSVNYIAQSFQGFTLILESKKKDFVTGSFYGTVSTQSGLKKEITDGKFSVQLGR